MSNLIIGMAGHIDHGKTTLVQALTGIDTDSLPEEKKRGMTIDIGFTKLEFQDGSSVGLIDVPGHEKFIKNMTAGVSSIDFVILVIACDDGIMPQTIEHFEIIKLLGIKNGIVVLTKRDLVDDIQYEKVLKQCYKFFQGTFLQENIFTVSPNTKSSYEELKNLIWKKIKNIKNTKNFDFRMNIDRSFQVKGFGTVVTGTISSGKVAIGDTLALYPQNIEVKVKNIQNHGADVQTLDYGHRCALNLANIDKNEIQRGNILAKNDTIYSSDSADAVFYLLPEIKKLKNNSRVRVDIGTSELICRINFADRNFLVGGETAYGKITVEGNISGAHGDIGIIRNYSPITTIGRIKILNIPSKDFKKHDENYLNMLKDLDTEKLDILIENKIKYSNLITEKEIENFARTPSAEIIDTLKNSKTIYVLDKAYIHKDRLKEIYDKIVKTLNIFHAEHSLEPGVEKLELKNKLFYDYSSKEFNALIEFGIENEIIKINGDFISRKDFKIRLNKEEKTMKEIIFGIYKNERFNLKSYEEIYSNYKDNKLFNRMHNYMVKNNFIIHTKDNHFILKGYLKEAIKIIQEYFENNSSLTVAKTRELLNCNRDSAILILQTLDSLKITKQLNDIRILIK